MARKKTPGQTSPSSQQFSHSPFKSLKGLCASKPAPSTAPASEKVSAGDRAPEPENGDRNSFADEMESLGVKPLAGRTINPAEPGQGTPAQKASLPDQSRDERDKAAFLEAVCAMDAIFKDEWATEPEGAKQNAPRRMKQVQRGQLKPEATLDLHGMTIPEATTRVGFFLQNASHHDFQTVLIITGKGLHSSRQPVLRDAVERLLAESVKWVLEWGTAPRRYGGDGALVVFLRRPVTE